MPGYHGPPALTVSGVFGEWTADLPTIIGVLVVGLAYFGAVRGLERRGGTWQRARKVAFGSGLGFVLLVSVTFLGVYADTYFWVRAAQVIVLLMIVPLCLALGSPVRLALETLPEAGEARLRRALTGKMVRFLAFPASASLLLLVTPWALFFTGWFEAMLRNGVVDELTRLALVVIGFVYFYGRLQLDPVPRRYPHLITVVITFVEVIFDAALGLVLWLGPHIVAGDYYQALHRFFGPDQRTDQIIGAGILWIAGDAAGVPFLGALMHRMSSDDASEAARIDRELDEQEAAVAASDEPAAPSGLWWENDPVLAERFRRERRQR